MMETFNVTRAERVYVYDEPVNMGKSFNGLTLMVEKKLRKKVLDGDLFLFFNKKRTYVKILFWAKNGICIFAKRLPTAFYDIESIEGKVISVKEMQRCIDIITLKRPAVIDVTPTKNKLIGNA